MKGTVKFYNVSKGFGFITAEDGNDYFVHYTGLNEEVKLFENDVVEFDVEDGERGPKAVHVRKADGEAGGQTTDAPAADDGEDFGDSTEDDNTHEEAA